MASNINANNIDGFYPVAGQDNDSQGFRDNFTNTRTNFQFAADEITDLQDKTILKAPLASGGNIEVINNMAGVPLIDFEARDVSYTFENLGTVSGSQIINYALGSYQQLSTSGSVNLVFTGVNANWPASGIAAEVTVKVNVTNVAHTITLTSGSTWRNAVGVQGAAVSGTTAVITVPTTGVYQFTVYTNDSGATLTLSEVNKQIQPFNNSLEVANIAASNVVSISTTVSVFDTTGGNLATLAAGVAGQVKILAAANVAAGNLEITVINPAWTGSGTVEFYGQGQTATFYYANSKWFCIGTGPDATGNIAKFS
jgi:hypothetical protein